MNQEPAAKKKTSNQGLRFLMGFLIKFIIPAVIVVAAVGFTKHQMDTRPQAKRKKPPRQARLVTVEPARQENRTATIDIPMGPVMPAQQVTLTPEVTGVVLILNPAVIPGGLVQTGQVLLNIDPRNYLSALELRQSDRARSYLNFKLEEGNQKIAQQEYELLAEEIQDDERELVLRQPHLASTKAALDAAEAAVKRAQLDLDRCQIMAPFNAVIETKHVDQGARVAQNSALVTLVGTDQYWIEVTVRVDKLKWIKIPRGNQKDGSRVKVFDRDAWGRDVWREGRVIRLLADLEPRGLLARLLVAVDDPLGLNTHQGQPMMLLGSKVRCEIEGVPLTGGIPLRQELVREGQWVWIMTEDKTLEIRPVEIDFSGQEWVYIRNGVKAGEKIVITDMTAPMAGMPLRLEGDPPAQPGPGKPQGGQL
jgi:RND family efflux transporter MFP subunit